MTTTLPAGWKPIESAPKDFSTEFDGWNGERIPNVVWAHPEYAPKGEYAWCRSVYEHQHGWSMERVNGLTHWMPLPAAPGSPPASAQPERDWELSCDHCDGDGFVYVERRVGPCATDIQTFKEECECCEGRGFTIAFADIPGIDDYVRKSRPVASAQDDAKDERSDTYGMNLGERIAHVGGRTNAQGYTEFGSPMAVNALIQHVLRDIDWTRQDDDGAYQARYRLPDGQWSSWGHVVCGVKGHEQELRYLPGARRPDAPAAGDARDDLTLNQKYEDACILANANARDAGRYRVVRKSIVDEANGSNQVAAASEAIGLERGAYPTPDQFDAIVDHIAAQQGKGDGA